MGLNYFFSLSWEINKYLWIRQDLYCINLKYRSFQVFVACIARVCSVSFGQKRAGKTRKKIFKIPWLKWRWRNWDSKSKAKQITAKKWKIEIDNNDDESTLNLFSLEEALPVTEVPSSTNSFSIGFFFGSYSRNKWRHYMLIEIILFK